jgi:hypothetical protein
MSNCFVATPASKRIWVSLESPGFVRGFLADSSKWGGSDKRDGARISFEIRRDLDLETVVATLVSMGMVDRSGDQKAMNDLMVFCD